MNYNDATLTAIGVDGSQAVPLTIVSAITPSDPLLLSTAAPYVTRNAAAQFTVAATSASSTSSVCSSLGVSDPPPTELYYWVDNGSAVSDHAAQWAMASKTVATAGQNPGVFNLALTEQSMGLHTLYYFAAYRDVGITGSTLPGSGNSSGISNLQKIMYAVLPATNSTTLIADVNQQNDGSSATFTATITPGAGPVSAPAGAVYFYDGSTLLG